jgi:phosphatidylglycerol:prolipoprotein diacylglycerol transferase
MPHAYLAFVAAGIAVGAASFHRGWRGAGLPTGPRLALFVAGSVLAGLLGARVYAVAEQGWRWEAVASVDGFRLPGGVAGLLIGLGLWRAVLFPTVPAGLIGDLGAIATQFGLAVIRLGCLAAGCCFGTVTRVPWAIRFPLGTQAAAVHASLGWIGAADHASLPVHPLQLYFLALHLAVGAFLLQLAPRKRYDGQLLLLALVIGQSGKAALECFRQPIGGARPWHLPAASAALAIAATLAVVVIERRRRTAMPPGGDPNQAPALPRPAETA